MLSTSSFIELDSTFIGINVSRREVSPYVVKAIGDITYLESGLSQKQYGYIDTKVNSGKNVTLEKSDNIYIEAYNGDLDFKYAKEVE